jgi:hypothetical protein
LGEGVEEGDLEDGGLEEGSIVAKMECFLTLIHEL